MTKTPTAFSDRSSGLWNPWVGRLFATGGGIIAAVVMLLCVGLTPAMALSPALQEQADSLTPLQRFDATLDTVAELEAAIELIDSWDVGREGVDGRLLEERRAVRTEQRRTLLWRLAELVLEVPAAEEPDPRLLMVDSLLRADTRQLGAGLDEWLEQASLLGAEAVTLDGAARARMEARVHELDTAIDEGLGALYRNLEARDSLGADVSDVYETLDRVLGVRAELLAGRMARAESDINNLRDRRGQGVTGLEEEIAVLDQDVQRTADNLESVLELMDARGLPIADFRRYLLVSTGTLTADDLNLDVMSGLFADWTARARAWLDEAGWGLALRIVAFLAILALARVVATIVNKLVVGGLQASKLDLSQLLHDTIVRWSTRMVMVLGLLIALSQLGVELGPVLAGLGVAGFVIGFALQDTLSNFASGVMILLYRPFDVGDVVEVGGVVGKVADMSLVSTTILSVDNQRYIIPNSKIWGDVIQNVTAENIRRVDLVFGIGYEDDIPEAERILEELVEQHELVLDEPGPLIKLSELGDSSVNFVVRPWCKTADYWDVRFDLTRRVKLRFDEAGISIPFPQRDVHVYHEGLDGTPDPERHMSEALPIGAAAGTSGTGPVGGVMRGEEGLDEADQTPD